MAHSQLPPPFAFVHALLEQHPHLREMRAAMATLAAQWDAEGRPLVAEHMLALTSRGTKALKAEIRPKERPASALTYDRILALEPGGDLQNKLTWAFANRRGERARQLVLHALTQNVPDETRAIAEKFAVSALTSIWSHPDEADMAEFARGFIGESERPLTELVPHLSQPVIAVTEGGSAQGEPAQIMFTIEDMDLLRSAPGRVWAAEFAHADAKGRRYWLTAGVQVANLSAVQMILAQSSDAEIPLLNEMLEQLPWRSDHRQIGVTLRDHLGSRASEDGKTNLACLLAHCYDEGIAQHMGAEDWDNVVRLDLDTTLIGACARMPGAARTLPIALERLEASRRRLAPDGWNEQTTREYLAQMLRPCVREGRYDAVHTVIALGAHAHVVTADDYNMFLRSANLALTTTNELRDAGMPRDNICPQKLSVAGRRGRWQELATKARNETRALLRMIESGDFPATEAAVHLPDMCLAPTQLFAVAQALGQKGIDLTEHSGLFHAIWNHPNHDDDDAFKRDLMQRCRQLDEIGYRFDFPYLLNAAAENIPRDRCAVRLDALLTTAKEHDVKVKQLSHLYETLLTYRGDDFPRSSVAGREQAAAILYRSMQVLLNHGIALPADGLQRLANCPMRAEAQSAFALLTAHVNDEPLPPPPTAATIEAIAIPDDPPAPEERADPAETLTAEERSEAEKMAKVLYREMLQDGQSDFSDNIGLDSPAEIEAQAKGYAVRLITLFETEERVMRYLKGAWTRGEVPASSAQPLHDVSQFRLPSAPVCDWPRRAWGDYVILKGPEAAKLVSFAAQLTAPTPSTRLDELREQAAQIHYPSAARAPALAKLCYSLQANDETFEKALEVHLRAAASSTLPNVTVTHDNLTLTRLPPGDPRGLFLGDFTHCCQSIGKAGEDCAIHGHTSPHSGFYVVTDTRGEIVGQSWASKTRKGVLLDSLESHPGRVSGVQWEALLGKLSHAIGQSLQVGGGGATPKLAAAAAGTLWRHPDYPSGCYSDATRAQSRFDYTPTPPDYAQRALAHAQGAERETHLRTLRAAASDAIYSPEQRARYQFALNASELHVSAPEALLRAPAKSDLMKAAELPTQTNSEVVLPC